MITGRTGRKPDSSAANRLVEILHEPPNFARYTNATRIPTVLTWICARFSISSGRTRMKRAKYPNSLGQCDPFQLYQNLSSISLKNRHRAQDRDRPYDYGVGYPRLIDAESE